MTAPGCPVGGCRMPRSGGPCEVFGYPRARAHASSISDALDRVDEVYVGGTALVVVADSWLAPGVVVIEHRAGDALWSETIRIPDAGTAPAAVGDLTDHECYRRWLVNRCLVEGGGRPLLALTPDQVARGRRLYQVYGREVLV